VREGWRVLLDTMKTPPAKTTILCGTDFSENSRSAARVAAALARHAGKKLALVHVAESAEPGAGLPEKRHGLQEEVAQLAVQGLSVRGEVLEADSAGPAILAEVAARPEVELLVVSSVSKTAIDRWTLGSVSERLAEAVAVPTLVVRDPRAFLEWIAGERPLQVFVAVDFSAVSRAALRWVAGLRKLASCEVTVAHINWPPADRKRLGLLGPMDLTENSGELQRVLERDLREMVREEMGDGEVSLLVQPGWGRVDAHLAGLAAERSADLLVVGTRQRAGWERWTQGSVSRGILRHAPMSVACVPGKPQAAPGILPCRRVLAAVDLDKNDTLALPAAYSIVHEEGTVCLLNVRSPLPAANPLIGGMTAGLASKQEVAERRARAVVRLKKLAPEGVGGIRTEVQVLEENDVAAAIVHAAETFRADIVCVGAHARPGMVARVMGSVALGVLQKCRRPVLVAWPAE
jgi:universal stress protein E